MGEKLSPRTTSESGSIIQEKSKKKESNVVTREQLLVADLTDLVQATVPDKFPTPESRAGMDILEDEFQLILESDQPDHFESLSIRRRKYPRGEKNSDGIYEPKSIVDEYFTIVIGNNESYYVNNFSTIHNGREFSEVEYEKISTKIKFAIKGFEDGNITPIIKRRDLNFESSTHGQLITEVFA